MNNDYITLLKLIYKNLDPNCLVSFSFRTSCRFTVTFDLGLSQLSPSQEPLMIIDQQRAPFLHPSAPAPAVIALTSEDGLAPKLDALA